MEGVKAVLPPSPGQGGSDREMPSHPLVLGLGSESSAGGATGWWEPRDLLPLPAAPTCILAPSLA